MLRTALLSVSVFLCAHLFAQPNPYGCHYFHQAPGPIMGTVQSRTQIDETIARSDTFDILHYDISLDLTNYVGRTIGGETAIRFVPLLPDVTSIRFDLFELIVDSVIGADGPLVFSHDGVYLDVNFDAPPEVGVEQEVSVHYRGETHRDPDWGGFYFESNYMYNLGIGISTIPPNFGKVWYPCFDSFVERASYTYHVKTSGTFRFRGQGELLGEVQLEGDTVVRSYHLAQEIPTHVSAVAVAAYDDHEYVHSGANGDIPVRLSAKSANLSSMVGRFGDLGAAIDACEYWYGPYAYGRVGYVLTTDGALEIPTNIAYPQFMTTQSIIENRGLLTHELGHSWWGDVVTPYIHNDMWLKEGPAEYSGHLIEEWLGGEAAFYKVVKDNHLFVLRSAHLNDGGFQPLSPMPDPYIYGTHTYYKGASVMHNLRGYLGDELFRQALRGIQQDNANTAITAEDFKNALEEQTGVDLDPFFDAWVFEPGFAAFEVRDMEMLTIGDMTEVSLLIGQKLRATDLYHTEVPLDITFISADGEVNDQTIIASGEETTVQLTVPFEPAMVVLNRYGRLNQARMDHEITLVPDVVFSNLLPYVDFRLYATELVDSTLVRIDHMWSGPDQAPLASDIVAIGNTHYWNVDGLWPEGTVLQGRLYYYGQANQFDEELIDGNENGIAVLYRPTPMDQWVLCPDQEVNAGNLTNGVGSITVSNLQKGQYCFGKIDGSTAIDAAMDDQPLTFTMGPVPTQGRLTLTGSLDGQGLLWCDIFGPDGRMVRRLSLPVQGGFSRTVEVSDLANGMYIMRIQDARSGVHQEQRFEVLR